MSYSDDIVLKVTALQKKFASKTVVEGVSFSIQRGETLALVGENSSGKTTLARMIVGLIPPTAGEIYFEGERLGWPWSKEQRQQLRGRLRMIFQNADVTLNPYMKVGNILEEPLTLHTCKNLKERHERIYEVLELVKLPAESGFIVKYPHMLSGGEKKRLSIARALVVVPQLIIADEALTAVDITLQVYLISVLQKVQKDFGTAILFITHNFSQVSQIAHRVAFMSCHGEIAEEIYVDKLPFLQNPHFQELYSLYIASKTALMGEIQSS